jgi:uncharacterized CHY-type Zn-finger protein
MTLNEKIEEKIKRTKVPELGLKALKKLKLDGDFTYKKCIKCGRYIDYLTYYKYGNTLICDYCRKSERRNDC